MRVRAAARARAGRGADPLRACRGSWAHRRDRPARPQESWAHRPRDRRPGARAACCRIRWFASAPPP